MVVRSAYYRALGRLPSAEESADSLWSFSNRQIDAYKADGKPDPRKLALTDFGQVLMGLNEFCIRGLRCSVRLNECETAMQEATLLWPSPSPRSRTRRDFLKRAGGGVSVCSR